MSPAERGTGSALVTDILARHLPGTAIGEVVPLGEGMENVAFLVDGELVVRLRKEPDPERRAVLVGTEAHVLATVAAVSPLPVPVPVFSAPELGCLAYRAVPGTPLLALPRPRWEPHTSRIAELLGGLHAAVHGIPVDRMADTVPCDVEPLPGWLEDAAGDFACVSTTVPRLFHRSVEAFLGASPPAEPDHLVFAHNDLGIEHVLAAADGYPVTGVIDWGDAAITDPAYDLGLLYRDLGPAALDSALGEYHTGPPDPALIERAVFYARCGVFEDLAHGLRTGTPGYVDKSLTALPWLFPAT
ncbi:bifunctional AAC/APH [Amycolatopsis antarctica]|uniref:Bifunctional AAC/APH n=1 Tax=Amycolatopsis antarctica TaxID=1854586 RepID=A0A263D6G1_9PSEU|nr:phosphotransferase [Amycolatopsis antarctica]OZM73056.1 bifunctional AAC/APH [Amycolatopsis antarctica]